jgi:hypothetical protein
VVTLRGDLLVVALSVKSRKPSPRHPSGGFLLSENSETSRHVDAIAEYVVAYIGARCQLRVHFRTSTRVTVRSAFHPRTDIVSSIVRSADLPDGLFGSSAVQPLFQKNFPSRLTQINSISLDVPSPRGALARSSRTRDGMRWTRQRQA